MDKTSPETMTKILAAVRHELGAHGLDGITMRGVAKRAEISVGTLQYYYATREALVEAALDVFQNQIEAVVDGFIRVLRQSASPAEVLSEAAVAMYRLLKSNVNDHRARQIDTLTRGEMHPSRRRRYFEPLMKRATTAAAERFGGSEADWRFNFRTVEFAMSRYALLTEADIQDLCDGSEEKPDVALEGQLRRLVKSLTVGTAANAVRPADPT